MRGSSGWQAWRRQPSVGRQSTWPLAPQLLFFFRKVEGQSKHKARETQLSKSDVSTGAREAAIVLCGHVMSYDGHVQQLLAVLKVDLLKDSDTKE